MMFYIVLQFAFLGLEHVPAKLKNALEMATSASAVAVLLKLNTNDPKILQGNFIIYYSIYFYFILFLFYYFIIYFFVFFFFLIFNFYVIFKVLIIILIFLILNFQYLYFRNKLEVFYTKVFFSIHKFSPFFLFS